MSRTVTSHVKLEATFVMKDAESGQLPMGSDDIKDLRTQAKIALGADDVIITGVKTFDNRGLHDDED